MMPRSVLRAFLLATTALVAAGAYAPAAAQNATWLAVPQNNDFNDADNWNPLGVPTATGHFDTSTITTLFTSLDATLGMLTTNPGSDSFNIFIDSGTTLTLNGAGVIQNGGSFTFFVDGTFVFRNEATAGTSTIFNSGLTQFFDTHSTAGAATITNDGTLEFHHSATGGSANITNLGNVEVSGIISFFDTATALNATITNQELALVEFWDMATAANATIVNQGAVVFFDQSTAGSAMITNAVTGGIVFSNFATAGSATITNNGGLLFLDNSTAGSAAITNNDFLRFQDFASAGSATLTNTCCIQFAGNSTAGAASITNTATGDIAFFDMATAGSATLFNAGLITFADSASGGTARYVGQQGGVLDIAWLTTPGTTLGSIEGMGTIALGDKLLTVGGNGLSTSFSGVLEGAGGGLTKVGGGTLTLTGTSTYTGPTAVDAGALIVNGSIASSSGLTVNDGGALGGTGTVPGTMVQAGGTIAAGNSVGTLTVSGNLALAGGALTIVEFEQSTADLIVVTGTAQIDGTIQLVPLGGPYSFNTPYTVVATGGGRTGTYATVDSLFGAAINPEVTYDAFNVYVTLRPTALPPGGTKNQQQVAGAVNGAIAAGANVDFLFPLLALPTADAIRATLDQLTGEIHTALGGVGFLAAGQFLGAMLDAQPRRCAGSDGPAAPGPAGRACVWGAALGAAGSVDGDGWIGSVRREERHASLAAGVDVLVAPGSKVGFALAGGVAGASLDQGRGELDTDVAQAGLYGTLRLGALSFAAAGALSHFDVRTERAIPILGLPSVHADYDALAWSGRFEGAWQAWTAGGLALSPFAAVQGTAVNADDFSEGVRGALAGAARTDATARTELGLKAEGRAMFGGVEVATFAQVAWGHYVERHRDVALALIGLPGASFTVGGAQPDADSALLSAGLDTRVTPSMTIGARLDGELSSNAAHIAGMARLAVAF